LVGYRMWRHDDWWDIECEGMMSGGI
jgi:hypothetical protein